MEVVMEKLKQFLGEEKGQATIEYFLLVGSIMVAAVMVFSSYYKMTYRSEQKYIVHINDTQTTLCNYVQTYLNAPGIC
jgi:Flp pilus assembly pilin Flp